MLAILFLDSYQIDILKHQASIDVFFFIGLMLLFGYIGILLSKRVQIPHVVAFILMGVILGRSILNIINENVYQQVEILSIFALAMVGFAIGGELKYGEIKHLGKTIPIITIFESLSTFIMVTIGVYLVTHQLATALLFGAISSATAPAATVSVLWQYGARGPLTTTIFSVVGLDDAAALIIYALASFYARVIFAGEGSTAAGHVLLTPLVEIFGSLLVGVSVGLALNYVMRNLGQKDEILIVTLGALLVCAGLARSFGLSMILTSMALGVTLINVSRRNRVAFDVIGQFNYPFILLLFVIVGSHVDVAVLRNLGLIGLVYFFMRVAGKMFGAWTGATISGAKPQVRKYLGLGLLPQAGVAIGLAIEISQSFLKMGPEGAHIARMVMNVIAATVLIFEIIGPNFVKYAIFQAGEVDSKYLETKSAT